MTNTGNISTYICELCRETIVDVDQAEHMELAHRDTRTFSLAEAMSDPTARCAVTVLVGNTRKVASYPTPYTPHAAVAEYLRTGWNLVSTTRDRVELSGGTSVVILVHSIPAPGPCEICERGCECSQNDPNAGCGHYACWGPRYAEAQRCYDADRRSALTRERLGLEPVKPSGTYYALMREHAARLNGKG